MSIDCVAWGARVGAGYDVVTYDSDSDEMTVVAVLGSARKAERAARKLARTRGLPVREFGRHPEIWVKSVGAWVKC